MTQAYPLQWPLGFPRAKNRNPSKFKTTLPGALTNVEYEIRRLGEESGKMAKDLVISSNFSLSDRNPAEPGVAIYFRWDEIDVCFPADQYRRIEENVQAIAKVIEAHRTVLRHGGFNLLRAAFRGFASLPPPTGPGHQIAAPWREVLGLDARATLPVVEARYRTLVKEAHPDRGGDAARFNLIVDAVRQARQELS